MGKATGKANHPHDSSRPAPKAVKAALAKGDMEALGKALTIRQKRFCQEYVVDFEGTAAAIRAGYAIAGAGKQAYVMQQHDGIRAYIDHLTMSKEAKAISVNPDYVLQKVTEIITKEGTRDGDKLRALELLARHLGMFVDRTEITGKDGGAIEVEQRKVEEQANEFTNRLKALRDRQKKDEVTLI